jgi:hypothetical protein
MPVTGHDILTDADAFKRAYPRWPSAEPDPLALPATSPALRTAYKHWGKAEALREVLAHMEREES